MLAIALLVHFTTVVGVVSAITNNFWEHIEGAKFSFAKDYDSGPRETKRIVYDYIKLLGVPFDDHRGLIITAGQPQMLDDMTATLKVVLQDHKPAPYVQAVLEDPFKMRENLVATTENDYTHALHGMFILVINTMLRMKPFSKRVHQYAFHNRLDLDTTTFPALGAQRASRSIERRYFFPDWLVSFPMAADSTMKSLRPKDILSTVEFKMGGSAFKVSCDTLDSFFSSGGKVAAIWSPDPKVAPGVIHYVPMVHGKVMEFRSVGEANKYDLIFDRVLEAAATALWADTKLTLFAANSQYFAAGPAGGYGARMSVQAAASTGKRDGDMDVDTPEDECRSPSKVKSIQEARNAARQSKSKANEPFVINALSAASVVSVKSKVIYVPSYGTAARPATLLAHVLALTYDKLRNAGAESKVKSDHSATAASATSAIPKAGKHALDSPSTAGSASKKKPALEGAGRPA